MRIAHVALLCAAALFFSCQKGSAPNAGAQTSGATQGKPLDADRAFALSKTFLTHVVNDEIEAAYAMMDEDYRAAVPLERFRAFVKKNTYLKFIDSFDTYGHASLGEMQRIDGTLARSAGHADVQASFHFAADGTIVMMSIEGYSALPTPGAE